MKNKLNYFFKDDIWNITDKDKPKIQQMGIKALKIILLSVQGFNRDLCRLRASALTLFTLMSIVPVIAMLFGVAKGFGFEKKLEQQLLEQASDQDTMMLQLIEFSKIMLDSTKGGLVAGIGIIVLLWTVIKVISNIEESFNHIWKIKKNRPWARKLSDYLSLTMLAPFFFISSSSITVFVKTKITWLVEVIQLPAFGTKMVLYGMSFSPLLIMSALFTFIYLFMPNQKIRFKAGVTAGIVTGILYQLVQWVYLSLQLGASSYNAIYGSFAALPLFLIWVQLGWAVVLFGCEISFFVQNYTSYQQNRRFDNLSFSLQKNIALHVCRIIVSCFANGEKAPNTEKIAKQLNLPISVVQKSLSGLKEANMIVELNVLDDEELIYQPSHDINEFTISTVTNALEKSGQNSVPNMNYCEQLTDNNSNTENYLLKEL